jgi:NADH-quinone oxidoreductase subunit A
MPVVMADLDPDGGAAEQLTPQATARLRELGVREPSAETIGALSAAKMRELDPSAATGSVMKATVQSTARQMAMASLWDIGVFFAVLMVGFAYVWRRGDLDWVRSVRSHAGEVVERAPVSLELEQRRGRPAGSILSA